MHSRILACRIPGTEEPGGLQSAGSQSQHDCSNLAGTDARTRQPHASPSAPLLLKPLSFIHPLLAALGLLWGVWAFSSCDEWAPLSRRRAAAAAAKSLQSCPTLCDPIDSSPPGSSVPGILQARILEWVAISFSGTETRGYVNN